MWERGDEGEEWREGSTGVSEGGKGKEKTGSVGDGEEVHIQTSSLVFV